MDLHILILEGVYIIVLAQNGILAVCTVYGAYFWSIERRNLCRGCCLLPEVLFALTTRAR